MKDYQEIYRDFCNTTRLRFKTFWHGLQERRRQEEEYLKQNVHNFFDKLFN